MTEKPETTPGWVVATAFRLLLVLLAATWLMLPWGIALMTSAIAWLAFEAGKMGARWHDDKEQGR